MLHQEQHEEPPVWGIFGKPVLKKRNNLENLLATSFSEIVLLLFYLEYDYSIQNSKVIQVKHLDLTTARAGIMISYLFNIKPLIVNSRK